MATWDDVARLARELPDTQLEGQVPAQKVTCKGKDLAWQRPYTKADIKRETAAGQAIHQGEILAVFTPDTQTAQAYVHMETAKYFITAHFAKYPAVLCRLEELVDEDIRELLFEARLLKVIDPGLG